MQNVERLVIVGQGYVGLPLAIAASAAGVPTTGLELNAAVVDDLNAGRSHIDDISAEQLRGALEMGYRATTEAATIAEADVVVVCVPTPLGESGSPDLQALRGAASTIGKHVRAGALVVLESTTYPGTTEEVFAPLVLGDRTAGKDLFIAFSPERVDPGNATFGISNTPKVVGGLTPLCTDRATAFYSRFIEEVVRASGAKEAELAKLLENTFRHVNIALVNEMLRFSRDLGIDLWNAIDCAATKPFGFMPFRPGPGVGGHCIPIDPNYLSHEVRARLGYSFRMVELAEEINKAAPHYVAERASLLLNERQRSVNGSSILLLGVAYKPDISDARETPATPIATRLEQLGADVQFHDPLIPEWTLPSGKELTSVPDPIAAVAAADLTILLQHHSSYDIGQLAKSAQAFLDTRGATRDSEFPHVQLL